MMDFLERILRMPRVVLTIMVGLLVAGGLGWGYCHVTYKKNVKRKTPFCAWHDAWHKSYWR